GRTRGRESLCISQIRPAVPIGWLWRVLHDQFDQSPRALASPVPRHRDTEIDARGDATTGQPVAVDADALGAELGAELTQRLPSAPVHRGTVAPQQSGGSQQEGACAYAAHPTGA